MKLWTALMEERLVRDYWLLAADLQRLLWWSWINPIVINTEQYSFPIRSLRSPFGTLPSPLPKLCCSLPSFWCPKVYKISDANIWIYGPSAITFSRLYQRTLPTAVTYSIALSLISSCYAGLTERKNKLIINWVSIENCRLLTMGEGTPPGDCTQTTHAIPPRTCNFLYVNV